MYRLDIITEIQKLIDEVEQAGPEALLFALFNLDWFQDMAVEEEGDATSQSTFSTWGFLGAQAYLWIIEEIMRKIPDSLLHNLAHGGPFQKDTKPYEVLNIVRMMVLTGPTVVLKSSSAESFDYQEGCVIWAGRNESEYIEYRNAIAFDSAHHQWILQLLQLIPKDKDWFDAVDEDLRNTHRVGFEDLFTTLQLLEYWMNNPEIKAEISPTIPIYRLDPEHLQNKLLEQMSQESVDSAINALTWNRVTDLSKHPIIYDNQGSYMFAHWFCRFSPGLTLSWLYPYFYYGHPTISGTAGILRGDIFEEYLKSLIETELGEPCVKLRKRLTYENYPTLSSYGIEEVDIDLAVNLGKYGLIVDAKGGMHELPKSFDGIRWQSITPDDVFHRFEENKEIAEKWDRVFSAVVQNRGILTDIGLSDCETLFPVVVHSKTQPIMLENYRTTHECPIFQTETHSISTLFAKIR